MALDVEDGKAVLFPVKSDADNAPDLSGAVNIDGTTYSVALWKNKSKSGATYYAGYVNEQEDEAPKKKYQKSSKSRDEDDEDEDEAPRKSSGNKYRKPSRR